MKKLKQNQLCKWVTSGLKCKSSRSALSKRNNLTVSVFMCPQETVKGIEFAKSTLCRAKSKLKADKITTKWMWRVKLRCHINTKFYVWDLQRNILTPFENSVQTRVLSIVTKSFMLQYLHVILEWYINLID